MGVYNGRFTGKVIVARLPQGSDLLEGIHELAEKEDIKAATLELIGAVQKAVLSYYDQVKKQYGTIVLAKPMEIASGMGNISLKDGKPFAHVHLTLADDEGKCFGGHLAQGTQVFMAEVVIREIQTEPLLERKPDPKTGLALWE